MLTLEDAMKLMNYGYYLIYKNENIIIEKEEKPCK